MRLQWVIRILALMFPILLLCADALARAGGGEGYGGGGGGGGGGNGGGAEGLGDLIFLLIRLIMWKPAIGIPAAIVLVAFIIILHRNSTDAYRSSVIRRGVSLMELEQATAMINTLKQDDPHFSERAFTARVARAFLKIQAAWANQDLQPVRPFISDAVHERFSIQFDEQRALGYRNAMQNVNVQRVRIVQVLAHNIFDVIAVRIDASAIDYKASLQSGAPIPGSDASGPFAEVWSFIRRRGVQTVIGKPGLIEGNCPNCGAAIEMNQHANCTHCGALLRSGQYDWVLAEITQGSEWRSGRATQPPGADALLQRDPALNVQALEDRASVIFWRYTAAQRLGNVDPLRKVAATEFCHEYAAELQTGAGVRQYYGECAVGSVDTLGFIIADEWERALVEVRWAGTLFEAEPNAQPRKTAHATLSRTVLELSRRRGATTDADRSISSAHCSSCGAPESRGESSACEFCGTVLNDGSRDWVLTAMLSPQQARDMLRDSPLAAAAFGVDALRDAANAPAPPTAGLLAWMIQMAWADGHVDPREVDIISRVAQRRGVPRPRLAAMIAAAQHRKIDLPVPTGVAESRRWLSAMATSALADGNVSREEYELLRSTGARAGLADYDIKLLIRGLRTDLYASSKEALRSARRT